MTRILYAEDDIGLQLSATRMFQIMDVDATVVSDGEEAWKLLDEGEVFDVVISDFAMPNMNGIELLKKIRNSSRLANTCFGLISGGGSCDGVHIEDICQELGATFFPKGIMSYADIVNELLDTKPPQ